MIMTMTMDEIRRLIATGQYEIRDIADNHHAIVPVDDYGQYYSDDVYHRQSYTYDDGTAYSVCISWGYYTGDDTPDVMMWINDGAGDIILYDGIDVVDYASYAKAIIDAVDTMGDILIDDDITMMYYRDIANMMRDIVDVYDTQWVIDTTDTYAVRIRTWREGGTVCRMPYIADAGLPWDNGRSDIVSVDMVRYDMSGRDRDDIRINDDDIRAIRDISHIPECSSEYRDMMYDIEAISIGWPIGS